MAHYFKLLKTEVKGDGKDAKKVPTVEGLMIVRGTVNNLSDLVKDLTKKDYMSLTEIQQDDVKDEINRLEV